MHNIKRTRRISFMS